MRTSPPTPARATDRGSDPPSPPFFPFKVLAALSFFRGRCFPAKYGRCNQRTVNRTVYRTGYSRRIYTGHHLHRPARPAPATCATHCNPKPTIRSPSVTASAYQCPPPHPTPLDQPRSGRFRRRCRGACSGLAAARRHVGRRRRLRRFGRGERLAGRRVRGNPVACKRREIPSRGNYDHQPPPPLPTPTNTTPSITNAATTIPTTHTHTMSSDARPRVRTMLRLHAIAYNYPFTQTSAPAAPLHLAPQMDITETPMALAKPQHRLPPSPHSLSVAQVLTCLPVSRLSPTCASNDAPRPGARPRRLAAAYRCGNPTPGHAIEHSGDRAPLFAAHQSRPTTPSKQRGVAPSTSQG